MQSAKASRIVSELSFDISDPRGEKSFGSEIREARRSVFAFFMIYKAGTFSPLGSFLIGDRVLGQPSAAAIDRKMKEELGIGEKIL